MAVVEAALAADREVTRETIEQARLISRAALFSGVPASRVADLARHAFTQYLDAGDLLFREGDRGHSMFVLGEGRVRLSTGAGDDETTLAVLDPPATFGELAIFDRGPRSATALAVEPSVVVGIPARAVKAAYHADPALADALLGSLAALVRAANTQRSAVVFWDLAGRVAAELAAMADAHGDGVVYLDHHAETLAARAGGSPGAVLRIVAGFERDGIVELTGSAVRIVRPDRLAARAAATR